MIKESLYTYIRKLLAKETYTNKQVAEIIAIGENVVIDVDKKRLQELYTTDEAIKPLKSKEEAKFLGIDEFKLHKCYCFAT